MITKKYSLLIGILLLISSVSFAQVGGAGSVYDSSVIPSKRMPQQTEFWNSTYNFPAKPRNMWEVGVSAGNFSVSGDVTAKLPTLGFEAHVRKAFGYIFSLRLQYLNGTGKGMAYSASSNYYHNAAWNTNLPAGKGYYALVRLPSGQMIYHNGINGRATGDVVYYNYKTKVHDLGLQGIFTLNNVRFHKAKTGIVVYGGVGAGVSLFHTMVNALDANGNNYGSLFNSINISGYKNRKDILKQLKSGMDKTYETEADNQGERRPKIGKYTLKPSGTVLVGVGIKLSKRINLAIEDRWTFIKDDLLDGQRWQEHPDGDAVLTRDFDSYNYGSIGLNINLGGKSVEPLWWLNPLDYAYDELKNHRNVVIPKSNCPDADGDGVCDHLDREPNTPAGCPVDTHGVTRDTDGDGVPDCKDKQLITPTECQPVDADGVGKCPDPECCTKKPVACPCDYPSLSFGNTAEELTADNKMMLATVASKMKTSADCKIIINGHPETSKKSQALCQKRVELIKRYLTEKEGISSDRISTNCDITPGADKDTIDVKCN